MGCIEHAVVVSIVVHPMSTNEGMDKCTLRDGEQFKTRKRGTAKEKKKGRKEREREKKSV